MGRDRRLQEIIEAGAGVFGERGYAACTMREVAARAGMSAATLYRYVQGREELLYLVQERILERAARSAEAALARRGPLAQLRTFVTDHIRRVAAFPAEARLLEEGGRDLPWVLARRIEKKRQVYADLACDLVEAADTTGRPARRATSHMRARMLLAMADRVGRDAAESGASPAQIQRLARGVIDLFLRGIRGKG